MKKMKVVKKVIVKEKKDVTPEAIQNEVSRILAVEAFNRWRDFFEMDDAMDDFEYCLEKFCESRCEGKKVLLVDLDPQADLSTCFGYGRTDEIDTTVSTMMTKSINEERFNPAEGFIQSDEGITLLPANLELSAMEMSLVSTMNRERILKCYLDRVKDNFDFVVIDCMPSLGMITINALSAADSVIIPVQSHYLPAKGMEQLLRTVSRVQRYVNPDLKVDGVLMTFVDNRTSFAKEVPEIIRTSYGGHIKIYDNQIPMRIKAAETAARGVSIFAYEPGSDVAKAYAGLAKEVIRDAEREKAKVRTEQCR